eukprot:g14574.t1
MNDAREHPPVEFRWIGTHERLLKTAAGEEDENQLPRKSPRRFLRASDIDSHPDLINVEMALGNRILLDVVLRKNRILLPQGAEHVIHHANGEIERQPLGADGGKGNCYYQGDGVQIIQEHQEVVAGASKNLKRNPVQYRAIIGANTCSGRGLDAMVRLTRRVRRTAADGETEPATDDSEHGSMRILTILPPAQDVLSAPGEAEPRGRDLAQRFIGRRHSLRILHPESRQHHYHEDVKSYFRTLSAASTKYVEVLAVNDQYRYQKFGGTPSNIPTMAAHTTAVMNLVNTIELQHQQQPMSSTWMSCFDVVSVALRWGDVAP